jgi:hypothetical protein
MIIDDLVNANKEIQKYLNLAMMLRDYELRVSIKDLMEYINMRLASR